MAPALPPKLPTPAVLIVVVYCDIPAQSAIAHCRAQTRQPDRGG
jgi:hypothetical protein